MTFTAPPPVPQRADPATFADRADAAVYWLFGTHFSELVAQMNAWGPGSPYCTVGGTADALTLTSGISIAALNAGQRVWFTPANANTAAITLNLDGRGVKAGKTVTGATMPAGYLIAGKPTSAIYMGTEFWVDRPPESGGTINVSSGEWLRMADGTQRCRVILNDDAGPWTTSRSGGALFMRASGLTWTYPKAFVRAPAVTANAERPADLAMGCSVRTPSTTSVTLNPWSDTSLASATSKSIHATAEGFWYV